MWGRWETALIGALATIGVYGFDLESFLETLSDNDITLVIDVRQRRGVRGARYAWANSRRLQSALAEAGIAYRHEPQLAPTAEIRTALQAEYARRGIGQRSRNELSPGYVERFRAAVLDNADLGAVVEALPSTGRAALMCLETQPQACHRSLVAERLVERHGLAVEHLLPPAANRQGKEPS